MMCNNAYVYMYAHCSCTVQVNGTVSIIDFSNYGMAQHNTISLAERKDFSGVWQVDVFYFNE